MARKLLVVLLGLVALATAPADAPASETQESIFQDDDRLLHTSHREASSTLQELRDLGVDRIRLSVIWRDYAPAPDSASRPDFNGTDPAAYPATKFDHLDHAIRAARQMGIAVLVNARGDVPDWAMPPRPKHMEDRQGFRPDPKGFGEFVAMLGRRYGGEYTDENQGRTPLPRVGAWSLWNEPNWSGHLQPQTIRDSKRRLRAIAPTHYRSLYRAGVDGLRASGHADDIILIGETAPVGNDKAGELSHIKPIDFLRAMFCLDGRNRPLSAKRAALAECDFGKLGPLHATGYAHHPYSVTSHPAQKSKNKGFATLADSDRLKAVLDAAAAAGRIARDLPLWYTEFGYQTAPPDPFRGVTLEQQAHWLVDAEYITSADPRIAALTQFLLRDDEPRTEFADGDARRWATYQTGLQFDDGRPKPALAAYRLPLRASPQPDGSVVLWGMVRPGGAQERIRIEYRAESGGDWRSLGERAVNQPRGYWTETIPKMAPGYFRFEWLRAADQPAPAEGGRPAAADAASGVAPVG